jgi:NADH:ubiquinone oxidoreductase subunit 5 (subunit L)/multisubunit Na+/H+ antiporter MnhA subunit
MIAAAWVCLLSPLAAALAITLAGMRISGRTAGWIATASTSVSFVAAAVAGPGPHAATPPRRLPHDVDRLQTLRG